MTEKNLKEIQITWDKVKQKYIEKRLDEPVGIHGYCPNIMAGYIVYDEDKTNYQDARNQLMNKMLGNAQKTLADLSKLATQLYEGVTFSG